MHIGMIGAGMVAVAVAREALAKGHQVVLSSRSGPAALAGKVAELGPGTLAATVREAAALDYVLLAVPWAAVEAAQWTPSLERPRVDRRYQPFRRD
jgi:8-hydroxy-5-deazaflavin:NADPH oxidoreductase